MTNAESETQRKPQNGRASFYFKHLWATMIDAPFAGGTWLYLVIVLVGVAVATWLIPFVNSSETSAETLGIYVIGILVAVFADSLFLWKKSKDDLIAETMISLSFILCFVVGFLSIKEQFQTADGVIGKRWRAYSECFLYLILAISILMWAMINVVEPRLVNPATDKLAAYSNLNGK